MDDGLKNGVGSGLLAQTATPKERIACRGEAAGATLFNERALEARDLIWIAILGSASRSAVDVENVESAVRAICADIWTPSPSLIGDAMEEMARAGHLQSARAKSGEKLTATPQGRDTLTLLLLIQTERPGTTLGQAGLRLKLAFIDFLPFDERRAQLQAAVEAHEEELAKKHKQCASCPHRGAFGKLWFVHDCERLRCDIALLRSMSGFNTEPSFVGVE
ncbi:MAG: hypothetical protein WC722_00860 [Rhodospirillales bacterium]|jgi:DNA-binding PadR family transcriptional regulator